MRTSSLDLCCILLMSRPPAYASEALMKRKSGTAIIKPMLVSSTNPPASDMVEVVCCFKNFMKSESSELVQNDSQRYPKLIL